MKSTFKLFGQSFILVSALDKGDQRALVDMLVVYAKWYQTNDVVELATAAEKIATNILKLDNVESIFISKHDKPATI